MILITTLYPNSKILETVQKCFRGAWWFYIANAGRKGVDVSGGRSMDPPIISLTKKGE
jgi:hypothetical protein